MSPGAVTLVPAAPGDRKDACLLLLDILEKRKKVFHNIVDEMENKYVIHTLTDFFENFEEDWYPTNPTTDTCSKIAKMEQGDWLVSEYSTQINLVAQDTEFSQDDLDN